MWGRSQRCKDGVLQQETFPCALQSEWPPPATPTLKVLSPSPLLPITSNNNLLAEADCERLRGINPQIESYKEDSNAAVGTGSGIVVVARTRFLKLRKLIQVNYVTNIPALVASLEGRRLVRRAAQERPWVRRRRRSCWRRLRPAALWTSTFR